MLCLQLLLCQMLINQYSFNYIKHCICQLRNLCHFIILVSATTEKHVDAV